MVEVIKTDLEAEQPYELIKDDKGRLVARNIRSENKEQKPVEEKKVEEPKKASKGKKFKE